MTVVFGQAIGHMGGCQTRASDKTDAMWRIAWPLLNDGHIAEAISIARRYWHEQSSYLPSGTADWKRLEPIGELFASAGRLIEANSIATQIIAGKRGERDLDRDIAAMKIFVALLDHSANDN